MFFSFYLLPVKSRLWFKILLLTYEILALCQDLSWQTMWSVERTQMQTPETETKLKVIFIDGWTPCKGKSESETKSNLTKPKLEKQLKPEYMKFESLMTWEPKTWNLKPRLGHPEKLNMKYLNLTLAKQTTQQQTKENSHNIYTEGNKGICNRTEIQLHLIWHSETKGKQN